MRFTFEVPGKPVPQGSMRSVGRVLIHSNKAELIPWRASVAGLAAFHEPSGWSPSGPMAVDAIFYLPRPKGHYRTDGRRKDSAPWWPVGRVGDVDKFSRALLDGLTDGGVMADDSQVVHLTAQKQYEDGPGHLWCCVQQLTERNP